MICFVIAPDINTASDEFLLVFAARRRVRSSSLKASSFHEVECNFVTSCYVRRTLIHIKFIEDAFRKSIWTASLRARFN